MAHSDADRFEAAWSYSQSAPYGLASQMEAVRGLWYRDSLGPTIKLS